MTMYVEPPGQGPSQGVWCDPPDQDDEPDYWCDTGREGLIIRDLTSLQRFFREKCRWRPAAVTLITRLVWTEGQAWQEAGPMWWRREATMRGDASKGGEDDGRPGV